MSQVASIEVVAENRYFINSLPDVFTSDKIKKIVYPYVRKTLELEPKIFMDKGQMLNYFFNIFTAEKVTAGKVMEEVEIEIE